MEDELTAVVTARLPAFLGAVAARRHAWGVSDSMLLIADWALAVTGRDPGAAWRGRYRTLLGAQRIIRRHGDKAGLIDAGFAAVGCGGRIEPNAVRLGDVGLVPVMTAGDVIQPVGAVRTATGWAVQGKGLMTLPANGLGGGAETAWRLTL